MLRIVATPFVASNIQTKKVKEVQDQLKQMEKKTLEQQDPKSLIQDTPLQAPSPSPATSEGKLIICLRFIDNSFGILSTLYTTPKPRINY